MSKTLLINNTNITYFALIHDQVWFADNSNIFQITESNNKKIYLNNNPN